MIAHSPVSTHHERHEDRKGINAKKCWGAPVAWTKYDFITVKTRWQLRVTRAG